VIFDEPTIKPSGAVVQDPAEAAERALRVAKEQKMISIDGAVLDLEVTPCACTVTHLPRWNWYAPYVKL